MHSISGDLEAMHVACSVNVAKVKDDNEHNASMLLPVAPPTGMIEEPLFQPQPKSPV